MDLLEYQGKQFFAQYGIPVSDGEATDNVDDAVAIADRVGYPVVVKAQVHTGGRGKAGGVKLAENADEARTHASNILGLDIKGHIVKTSKSPAISPRSTTPASPSTDQPRNTWEC